MAYRIEQVITPTSVTDPLYDPPMFRLIEDGITIDQFDTRADAVALAQSLAEDLEGLIYHFDADIEAPEVLASYKAELEDLEDLLGKESN
ncbi:MAG TPA: hypothetical protein DIT46_02865 [Gemmatimonadetes bacterium]|nr:hypothetical protein [Gemmatimonadota bacterium]